MNEKLGNRLKKAEESRQNFQEEPRTGGYGIGRGQALFGTGRVDLPVSQRSSLLGRLEPIKVAAYIRVSTEFKVQEESFEVQEQYFSRLIQDTPGWSYAGIYSDYGISGTNKEDRMGFRRLLRHCKEGKIDRILCKSISRFTRNTEDLLDAVRILNKRKISILFEKEGIDTAEPVNEFVLTTLAALAQEESRSMSENIKSSIRMRFSKGEVFFNPIYGYRVYKSRDPYGHVVRDVVIEPKEAEVVRFIYRRAIKGDTYASIARELNRQLIPYPVRQNVTRGRKGEKESPDCGWTGPRVTAILKTERYTGDAICQKTYKRDIISHRDYKNTGQAPQYVVRDNHPAIISREDYAKVQKRLEARKRGKRDAIRQYPLSGRVVCGKCGRVYQLKNSTEEHQIWQCPLSVQNTHSRLVCDEPGLYDVQLYRVVKKGFAERFHMLEFLDKDGEVGNTPDDFLQKMSMRFEQQVLYDTVEEDRAFLKRRYSAAHSLEQQNSKRLQNIRKVMVSVSEGELMEKLRAVESRCQFDYNKNMEERMELEEEVKRMERYWMDLENDYGYRKEALKWLRAMPGGKEGILELMQGLTSEHLKAWVMKLTVESPFHYRILWYDNHTTEVHLRDNLENMEDIRNFEAVGWIW